MIILFDGVCNLCNRSVQFIIARDKRKTFRFTSLQSAAAKEIIQSLNATISGEALRSVILIKNNCIYTKSKAALLIAKELDGLWPVLCIFVIIPPFIRNWVYDFIAANRYKWFGKKDSCLIPSPELKDRFL